MQNQSEFLNVLANLPAEGLSIEDLATVNESTTGFSKTLGMRFTQLTPETVRAELHVSDGHLQITGIVNGGVYSSLAETAGSVAGLIAAKGQVVVGMNCNTDFLAPVSAGVIDLETKIIHAGSSTQLIKIKMYHRGKLVARSTLRTMVLNRPAPAPKKDKFEDFEG
ncbi:PaaI family thioesterase [Corynebacterium sp. 153RC1]|uniref:PaaI family thioesterase n=1 Tax=Corynebacterium TaxID=1716 RepID=UPI00211C8881|nr:MULTISPECIES: PaaI family thioesterase [unclassified Corynebacterium]MCQ9342896.1 PaaI family thioesterase [Corynebacterium sp. 76QC2CO]MCQ9352461.1 PaaI family thioesterase [Corynebacterium sp. 209RC1]MCQ9354367.1 PaaI family thioesterase [Corynebacterium sp. 1222RC1]MCQ9356744.1 PaaI family thioesterase [Corynebacterium sp. 122RC1]MCQ9358762.1 PaaI family thioesterase [Corynebacterium sp. 142RC1]